jgi:hypothetical protein
MKGHTMEQEIKIRTINISRKEATHPETGEICRRHSTCRRKLKDIGVSGPSILEVIYSKHYSPSLNKIFTVDMTYIAGKGRRYTNRVRRTAVDFVVKHNLTLEDAVKSMSEKYFVELPLTTIHDWVVEELNGGLLHEYKDRTLVE